MGAPKGRKPWNFNPELNRDVYCLDCNKKIVTLSAKRCGSCARNGKFNGMFGKKPKITKAMIRKIKRALIGRKNKEQSIRMQNNNIHNTPHSEKTRRLIALKAHKRYLKDPTKWPTYIDGRSGISDYPVKFNTELIGKIKKRDVYICQNCKISEFKSVLINNLRLSVHHIDYNKKNIKPTNLITLCVSCNSKANYRREYWQNFYSDKISEIYRK